jgi:uncharacterized membrane protein YeaQ/YmgE (transglycosylase-associated protein family)
MWYWILYILIGALAGWIGGMIVKGSGSGFIVNVLLGVVGAVVGGWVARLLGLSGTGLVWSLLVAIGGAIILLLLWGLIKKS